MTGVMVHTHTHTHTHTSGILPQEAISVLGSWVHPRQWTYQSIGLKLHVGGSILCPCVAATDLSARPAPPDKKRLDGAMGRAAGAAAAFAIKSVHGQPNARMRANCGLSAPGKQTTGTHGPPSLQADFGIHKVSLPVSFSSARENSPETQRATNC